MLKCLIKIMRYFMKRKVVLSTILVVVALVSSATIAYAKVKSSALNFDFYDKYHFYKSAWSNGGNFDCTWTPDNVVFEDGKMKLIIDKNESGYTAGEYCTKKSYSYGYYQVNMKPIKNTGVVSSFFTYGTLEDGTSDEIDIEFLGYDTTKVQFNYYTKSVGGHEYLYDLGFDASEEYHTYGFNWYEGGITWYVDGVAVYTAVDNVPDSPGRIMMNAWPGKNLTSWIRDYDGTTGLVAYYDWMSYGPVKTD